MALCERANGAVAEFMAIKFLDTHRVLHIISTATTLTPSYVQAVNQGTQHIVNQIQRHVYYTCR